MGARMRFVVGLCLCLTTVLVFGQDAKADQWVETYRQPCAGGVATLKVTCTREGEEVKLRFGCGNRIAEYKYTCRHPEPAPSPSPRVEKLDSQPIHPESPDLSWFEYQLAIHTSGLMVAGELPSTFYVGGEFTAQLKLGGKWWMSTALGLGYARVGGNNNLALTDSFGLQYRLNADWQFGIVARHYVALDGQGDVLQAVLPALEINYNINEDLQAVLTGGAGWGHFRVSERVSAESSVAPAEYRTSTRDSLTGTLGLSLRARF